MGIASFIISIAMAIILLFLIVVAGVVVAASPGGINTEAAGVFILGLSIIGCLIADLGALGLGIAGCVQKTRKKIFAILGVVFSSVVFVGTGLLIIIGNKMP